MYPRSRSARERNTLRQQPQAFALLLCAAMIGGGGAARAQQPIPPRIMVVFDTSSSMAWRVDSHQAAGGDGSFEFPTAGQTTCRLYEAKEALRAMLLSVGEVEARFGLARYHQEEGLLVNRFPAEYPAPIHYRGTCEGGDILVPFGPENLPAVLAWIDQRESWPLDPELRADGPTPLAGTLEAVRDHFRDTVLPADPLRQCRQHALILLTDAQDTCGGDPVAAIRALQDIWLADGDGPYAVRVYVVGFGRLGNEGEQALNALAIAAGTAVAGRAYHAEDRVALQVALGQIIGRALPHEVCDGLDNDCDGETDEGVLNACGECGPAPEETCNGLDDDCDGETDEGVRNACGECGPEPVELRNGIDDDCDGMIDEGFDRIWQPEVCDGLDNDLDGFTDEEVVRPCGSALGICRQGVERCLDARWSGVCEGEQGPQAEECNGLDDDCDGTVDGMTRPCGSDVGQCRSGVQRCVAGVWEEACVGEVPPRPESCDGRDDDCDGETDEGVLNACGTCGAVPDETCNGLDEDCDGWTDEGAPCPQGYTCVRGSCTAPCFYGQCPGSKFCAEGLCVFTPCDVLHCPPGMACDPDPRQPRCIDPCADVVCPAEGGERRVCRLGRCEPPSCYEDSCPLGMLCRAGACQPDPCHDGPCSPGQVCRNGECLGSCAGVRCPAGEECRDGSCVALPCRGEPCPLGQVCLGGLCGPDPCAGVVCRLGTECRNGVCTDPPCRFVHCPAGQHCLDGSCFGEEQGGDAGVPDADAGAGDLPDAGPGPDPGKRGPGEGDGGEGGCGCGVGRGAGEARSVAPLAVAAAALLLALGRKPGKAERQEPRRTRRTRSRQGGSPRRPCLPP